MYQSLPDTYAAAQPILDRILREIVVQQNQLRTVRVRPDPPRSLIAQPGSLEALITWNAPQNSAGITGWHIWKDNEGNLVDTLLDATARQYKIKLPADTPTGVYVSSFTDFGNEQIVDSIKVPVIAKANTDQYVTAGTGGGTGGMAPSVPPDWPSEPSGGNPGGGQEQ